MNLGRSNYFGRPLSVAPRFADVIPQADERVVMHQHVNDRQPDDDKHGNEAGNHVLVNKYSGKSDRISTSRCRLNSICLTGNCGVNAREITGP
jgi:hypothetical protein